MWRWGIYSLIFFSLLLGGFSQEKRHLEKRTNSGSREGGQISEILIKVKGSTIPGSVRMLCNKFGAGRCERLFKSLKKEVLRKDLGRWFKIAFPRGVSRSLLEAFRRLPEVEHAELNAKMRTFELAPNDPYFSSSGSWGQAYDDQWALKRVSASSAWDLETGSSEVVIAVVDTGVDLTHVDISGKLTGGWDFVNNDSDPSDDNGHGTHVAGIAAASTDNSEGIAGLSWGSQIMPIKVLDESGEGDFDVVAQGIVYAADNGADIINLSLGGYFDESEVLSLKDAIDYAYELGCVVVAAAGNENIEAKRIYPACFENVIAVASTSYSDEKSNFSNFGRLIDISAPGGSDVEGTGMDILSLRASGTAMQGSEYVVGTDYYRAVGTSMAAPFVSAAVALLKSNSNFQDWPNRKLMGQVICTADDIYSVNPSYDGLLGVKGRLNAYNALVTTTPEVFLHLRDYRMEKLTSGHQIVCKIKSLWEDATNVWATLSTTSSFVTINTSSISLGDMQAQNLATATYPITISSDAPDGEVFSFTLTLDATGYTRTIDFEIPYHVYQEGFSGVAGLFPFSAPAIGDIDGDGYEELGMLSWLEEGTLRVYVYRYDGEILWYKDVDSISTLSAEYDYHWAMGVTFADLDGDGLQEVIVGAKRLWVLRSSGSLWWIKNSPTTEDEASFSLPVIEDLDGDGSYEVISTWNAPELANDNVYVWRYDGSDYTFSVTGNNYVQGSCIPAVGDVEGDGDMEIVVSYGEATGAKDLYLWHHDGSGGVFYDFSGTDGINYGWVNKLILADLEGDGNYEILASGRQGGQSAIFVWEDTGSFRSGFPVYSGLSSDEEMLYSPVAGDIDGDGLMEIFAGSANLYGLGGGIIYAYNDDGSEYKTGSAEFVKIIDSWALASPILADVDGDGLTDLIAYSGWDPGYQTVQEGIYAWDRDGDLLGGYPRRTGELAWLSTGFPAVCDLDKDGDIELVIASEGGDWGKGLVIWDLISKYDPQYNPWEMIQHNPRHTGRNPTPQPPEIISLPEKYRLIDTFYSFTLEVRRGKPPYSWECIDGSLPDGLTLDSGTGIISGTPTVEGTWNFKIRVTDSVGDSDTSPGWFMTIYRPLQITSGAPTSPGYTEKEYSFQFLGDGGVPDYSWSATPISPPYLPPGLTLESSTGLLSGVPTTPGTYNFTVTLRDSIENSVTSDEYTIIIYESPRITSGHPKAFWDVGIPYSFTFTAEDGTSPYSWSYEGSLPPGLELDPSSGVLSGTPEVSGGYTFDVTVTDVNGGTDTLKDCRITILEQPSILSSPTSPGFWGELYEFQFEADGGIKPYTWEHLSGSLPDGLSLSESGVLSGTPSKVGTFTFTIRVNDSIGGYEEVEYTIIITLPLKIASGPPPGLWAEGVEYSFTFVGAGGSYIYSWSFSGTLPSGLLLDSSTGVLSGVPRVPGTYSFEVILSDSLGTTVNSPTYTIVINTSLSMASATPPSPVKLGSLYGFSFTASGGATPYVWSYEGAIPHGLSLSSSGYLSGVVTTIGEYSFTVVLQDATGKMLRRSCLIEVTATGIKEEKTEKGCGFLGLEPILIFLILLLVRKKII